MRTSILLSRRYSCRIIPPCFLALSLVLVAAQSPVSFSQDNEKPNRTIKWEPFVETVQGILAGKQPAAGGIVISPGAHLIFGTYLENLSAVVNGESKECSLNEGPTGQMVWMSMKINDPEDAAFLTLKTRIENPPSVRYHTVVFMKDSTGHWSIQTWHTSEGKNAD